MKISKKKQALKTALEKIRKSKDFGSDCRLDPDESLVIYELLTETAVRVSALQKD